MANENIELQQPNFCWGPQLGTMCTIDTTNVNTVLRVKDTSGGTIVDYSLTSNIINELIAFEYVGPINLSGMVDGLTFFTVEKVSNSQCMIKRWETQTMFSQLYLKEQIIKYSTGNDYYDITASAIEYYNRSFTVANAGASGPLAQAQYIEMDSVDGLKLGTRLFLGPSTDPDNSGATEVVHVSSVVTYVGKYRVYLTSPVQNQYKIGNMISLYTHLYLYSKQAYGGSLDSGTIYKLDAYSWNKIEADTEEIYGRITAARWCPIIRGIAGVVGSSALFMRPYESYSNWRSLFLKNYAQDNTTPYDVYDILFNGYSIYKLQDKTTLRDDNGNKQTFEWDTYNYQEDTLLPYSDSINMWMDRSILINYSQSETINIQVRDQYNISLRDVNVNLYIEPGDIGASFDPLSGYGVTDMNGRLAIQYISGTTYEGHTKITGKADKSSTSTGSEFIWNSNNFISILEYAEGLGLSTKTGVESSNSLKQIGLWYEDYRYWKRVGVLPDGKTNPDWFKPDVWLVQKSFFTTPGGDWVDINSVEAIRLELLFKWLPELYKEVGQLDAPKTDYGCAYPFENWDDGSYCLDNPLELYPICNQIRVVEDFVSENTINTLTDFLIYEWCWVLVEEFGEWVWKWLLVGVSPYTVLTLPAEENSLQISQLKLSKHTHYVDGQPYDHLWVYDHIDQFVFVEDAVPKFWSEKNPITTNIWIRLRPFVFSLDNTTLRMFVREVSYAGDTGYYEVTEQLTLTNFDAGGGSLGIEVLYNSIEDFHHAALVFVRIEVYDIAAIPNFIDLDYWFNVIPDFKAPHLSNLLPGREEDYVNVNTEISFEIYDTGTGLDLSTLECFLNSIKMDISVEEYDRYHCKVTYVPSRDLYYGKTYKVTVKISDSSDNVNRLNDAWQFYTGESDGVRFVGFDPIRCKRGASRFKKVSVIALGDGGGVDKDSIKLQVLDKDVDTNKIPIVYRVS